MDRSGTRRIIFFAIVAAAIFCIIIGINNMWKSFRDYDEAILQEKDSQFYSLIESNDINIDNTIDSYIREAESVFERRRLTKLRKAWANDGGNNGSEIRDYLNSCSLHANPVCADIIMFNKNKPVLSLSGNKNYSFLTDRDDKHLRICADEEGNYYLAYEYKANKNIRYDALMDLRKMFTAALADNTDMMWMFMDAAGNVVLYKPEGMSAEDIKILPSAEEIDPNMARCKDFMNDMQDSQTKGGNSIELDASEGGTYTGRMVVVPSGATANKEFAIGVTANYDQAIKPSRKAARRILFGGILTVIGMIAIITIMLFLGRMNSANASALRILKKRNAAMEELNQNMLALSHHQRLETIGTMTASIAHDFNNLLTPIMGYSMMSMEMLDESQTDIQENLMEVYNASVKAKDMVTRLAELSKKGKEETFIELDPAEIIRNSLKVTVPAKPKNVEVRGRFHSGRSRMRGDSTQISQLIINIVLNAYDAMREKGGTLYVSSGIEEGRIVMRFRDTGDGMDAQTVARIFDPFYTTKESGKGTGLGLAIVAQIAETHGGKVYVDSTPGEGTEFRITFPVIEKTEQFDKTKTIQISSSELRAMMNKGELPEDGGERHGQR